MPVLQQLATCPRCGLYVQVALGIRCDKEYDPDRRVNLSHPAAMGIAFRTIIAGAYADWPRPSLASYETWIAPRSSAEIMSTRNGAR